MNSLESRQSEINKNYMLAELRAASLRARLLAN
jgi:hypothetical protein